MPCNNLYIQNVRILLII